MVKFNFSLIITRSFDPSNVSYWVMTVVWTNPYWSFSSNQESDGVKLIEQIFKKSVWIVNMGKKSLNI